MTETNQPRILITNDDGITAGGLKLLARAAARFGEVTVVAPAEEQSAMSHGITTRRQLSITRVHDGFAGIEAWQVDGKPADCVIMAFAKLDRPFDLVFSGINHGTNLGIDINYSGTVGAASEGVLYGVPAAAFSSALGDDELTTREIDALLEFLFDADLWRADTVINVNFPAPGRPSARGIRMTCQALSMARPYPPDSDLAAWTEGYIAVTPIGVDRTRYEILNEWKEKHNER